MNREEIVVRNLIREWLVIEQATDDGATAGAAAASALSGIDSLESQVDSALERIEDKIESKNEAIAALVLGFALSVPTLAKWAAKAISLAVKGYASLAAMFSDSDQSDKLAWAKKIEAAGVSFYEKGHHIIEGFYAKAVKALFLLLSAAGDPSGIDAYKAWADSASGEAAFVRVAKFIDLAVTCVLAVYSVQGAISAIKTAHSALAATETVLSAVKGAHIATGVSEAISGAARAFAQMFAEAGVAAALISDLVKKSMEFFEAIKSAILSGVEVTKRAAQAAGLAVALASGPGDSVDAPGQGSEIAQRA
jgi:hypothetical protein